MDTEPTPTVHQPAGGGKRLPRSTVPEHFRLQRPRPSAPAMSSTVSGPGGRAFNPRCALRLNLPRRTTRRVPRRVRQPLTAPPVLNRTWALDFMSETLYDGRRVRLLTVIDEGNREGLEIAMGLSVPSQRVVRVLNELVAVHGCPAALRTDNGPEFIAQPFID